MRKLIFSLGGMIILSTLFLTNNVAQQITTVEKTEVYEKEHIPKKDPLPYPFVREGDVMWEKVVWRIINLREKLNHPLYFPTLYLPIVPGQTMNLSRSTACRKSTEI